MKVQLINCLVGVRVRPEHEDDHPQHQVPRVGVDAVPVTELAILQALNGPRSITMCSVQGEYETTRAAEYERLKAKYRAEHLALVYPGPSMPMPETLADIEIGPDQMDPSGFKLEAPVSSDAGVEAARAA